MGEKEKSQAGLLIIVFIFVLSTFFLFKLLHPVEKHSEQLVLSTDKGALKADMNVEKGVFSEKKASLEFKAQSLPVKKIDFFNVEEETLETIRIGQAEPEENFAQVYSIDTENADFESGEVKAVAEGNSLFKCKQWNFEEQKCEGRWKKIRNLERGEEYSFAITPRDPGFAEVDKDLLLLDSEGFLVKTNQTFTDESRNVLEIMPDKKEGSLIKKIIIRGYRSKGSASELLVEEKNIRSVGSRTFSIDPSSLPITNLTLHIKPAIGKELIKCREWNFTSQRCEGSWKFLKKLSQGEEYTILLKPEDPALSEVNGSFFEGFEGSFDGSYDNPGWTTSGPAVWNPDENSAKYSGKDSLSASNTGGTLSWHEINISTQNYTNIVLSFYYKTKGTFSAGEYIGASWWNGSGWVNVLNTSNIGTFTLSNTSLGSTSDDNDNFRIRVECLNNKNNEYCFFDDISVSGTLGDTVSPVINSINASPDPVDYSQLINFTANVTDDSAVDSVWLFINGTRYNMSNSSISDIYYYDDFNNTPFYAGTYNYTVLANDTSGNNATNATGYFTINELISIETTGIPINFSSVQAGDIVNASAGQGWPAYVKNVGNVDINISIRGKNLTGQADASSSINVSRIHWDTATGFLNDNALLLTYSPAGNATKDNNETFYFRLYTPTGIVQQDYQGNVSFLASKK